MNRHKHCPACGVEVDAVLPYQCSSCSTWQWANPKPCAGALVERDGQVLMLKRAFDPWNGHWDIPGGFVNDGEHPALGAQREVYEETGLTVPLVGLLGMWMDVYADTLGDQEEESVEHPLTTLNIYYLANGDDIDLDELIIDRNEATEAAWFGPEDPIEPLGFPTHFPQVLQTWREVARGERSLGPV